MTGQTYATLALAFFAFIQALGLITRVIVAYKQYKLDRDKFTYRKDWDNKRNERSQNKN